MIKHKIAFDLNGNDNGQAAGYAAAFEFAKNNPSFELTLIGDFENTTSPLTNLILVNNIAVPSNPKDLRSTLRENTSMNYAIDLAKQNKVDAILSSGDSGSYISGLTMKLGRLNGVSRPAFMPVCSAINGRKFLFMDVGANLVVKPEYLVEWAKLGSQFYKVMFNEQKPKVALLNIGTEDYKGHDFAIEANSQLKNQSEINYIGFQETRDLFRGNIDVAIIDGYGGNLVLKSYEGAIFTFKDLLKERIISKTIRKIGAILLKGAFKEASQVLDYRNVGSAWVIGVNTVAIKAHGSSDKLAYSSALNVIKEALEKDLLNKLKGSLDEQSN
ncbi:phosphate acyltransferase PlsX [Mycoplasmopsis gallopavonis]|uniref:Phosphate acyltransferase n=1 Tax=Mycoplasmopsis gallopavonis TaxID=76629 RepID=A0A449AYR7_9BACT|nr:phosphate acyltransferase PlsX [Mycoplasmopsis gallopavonis]RIV16682.1 phosphate acyltransferase PlsX [Mycoplasmopsis gallopavonis]VEU72651.1 fatty acid/phospholipid synthesis protein PlsX [Mycoplasmopsis gallopavonis]